jgi:hypothetical protein
MFTYYETNSNFHLLTYTIVHSLMSDLLNITTWVPNMHLVTPLNLHPCDTLGQTYTHANIWHTRSKSKLTPIFTLVD